MLVAWCSLAGLACASCARQPIAASSEPLGNPIPTAAPLACGGGACVCFVLGCARWPSQAETCWSAAAVMLLPSLPSQGGALSQCGQVGTARLIGQGSGGPVSPQPVADQPLAVVPQFQSDLVPPIAACGVAATVLAVNTSVEEFCVAGLWSASW